MGLDIHFYLYQSTKGCYTRPCALNIISYSAFICTAVIFQKDTCLMLVKAWPEKRFTAWTVCLFVIYNLTY